MDYDISKHITANSNECDSMCMTPEGLLAGTDWTNATVEGMVQFLGIILKMSVDRE